MELVALGEQAEHLAAGHGRAQLADEPSAAAERALELTEPGDWIVIKASRGMRLERVADALRAAEGQS
jgi:UDP-N-acetylmuramyl pentapeptide synthase